MTMLDIGRIILEIPKSPLKVTVLSVAKRNGQIIYDKSTEHLIRFGSRMSLSLVNRSRHERNSKQRQEDALMAHGPTIVNGARSSLWKETITIEVRNLKKTYYCQSSNRHKAVLKEKTTFLPQSGFRSYGSKI